VKELLQVPVESLLDAIKALEGDDDIIRETVWGVVNHAYTIGKNEGKIEGMIQSQEILMKVMLKKD
jgi:hypothetical protein